MSCDKINKIDLCLPPIMSCFSISVKESSTGFKSSCRSWCGDLQALFRRLLRYSWACSSTGTTTSVKSMSRQPLTRMKYLTNSYFMIPKTLDFEDENPE